MPLIKVKLSRAENIEHYGKDIIEIDFEEYLKGVVPSEIGNAPLEACKAQAVAARTFALQKSICNGQITDKSSCDQAFRVSRISSSYPNAQLAVEETRGQVLYYNDELIKTCPYSSSNGGHIVSSQERWGGYRPYLISKDDPYDTAGGGGHGVGMSQAGAKKMASLNMTYKDILAFYYPGTSIKEGYGMGNAEKVKQWCLAQKGCGYVWGTTGQKLTKSLLDTLYQRHAAHIDYNLCWKLWANKICYDCAGFAAQAMKQVGFAITAGATSAWNSTKWARKGTIDTLPKDKVCCLYRRQTGSTTTMQHTGVYLGDGTFMDARGTKYGVIGPNKLSSYAWTHWAIPPQLDDETPSEDEEVIKVAYQATVTASSGKTVNMRESASSSAKVIIQVAIGQVVDVISTTGDWSLIVWNNKKGYMMSKFLKKKNEDVSPQVWYVRLECKDEAEAKAIAAVLAKAQATT